MSYIPSEVFHFFGNFFSQKIFKIEDNLPSSEGYDPNLPVYNPKHSFRFNPDIIIEQSHQKHISIETSSALLPKCSRS